MSSHIYDILKDYLPGQEDTLRTNIAQFSDQINNIDPRYAVTPITYFCKKHLGTKIHLDVLKILVEEFKAEINPIPHNNQIPLKVFFEPEVQMHNDDIAVIEYLLYHTDITLLIRGSDTTLLNLLIDILTHKALLSNVIQDITNTIIDGDFDHSDKCNLYDLVERALLNKRWIINPMSSMQFLIELNYNISTGKKLFDPIQLFVRALKYQNLVLADILNDRYEILKYSKLDWQQVEYSPVTKKEYFTERYAGEANIVLFQSSYHIPDLVHCDSFSEPLRQQVKSRDRALQQQIQLSLCEYLSSHDKRILDTFGTYNNIFHLLALCPDCFSNKQLISALGAIPHDTLNNLLYAQNALGDTPIKLALLRHNRAFLLNYHDALIGYYGSHTAIDGWRNTIGHIIVYAKYTDSIEAFSTLLESFNMNLNDIAKQTNSFGATPLYYAIQNYDFRFLNHWVLHHLPLNMQDKNEQTLWHYFCRHLYAIETNSYSERPNMWPSLLKIYQILKEHIGHLVDQADRNGVKPIHFALLKPGIMQLLLNDQEITIDFTYKDKMGNTLQHLLAEELALIIQNEMLDNYLEVVKILIKHSNAFKENYNIKNKLDQLPMDIIARAVGLPLATWMHEAISRNIIRHIASMNNKSASSISGDTDIDVYISSELDYQDNLVFSTESILEQARQYNPNTLLNNRILYLIKATSLEIVYTNINHLNDKLLHYLINHHFLYLSTEISVINILKTINEFDASLMRTIMYTMYNRDGELIIHSAAKSNYVDLVSTLMSIDHYIINHPISVDDQHELMQDEQYINFIRYPADYATLYGYDFMLTKIALLVQQYNNAHPERAILIQCHWPQSNLDQGITQYFAVHDTRLDNVNIDDARKQYEQKYSKTAFERAHEQRDLPLYPIHAQTLLIQDKTTLLFAQDTRIIESWQMLSDHLLNSNLSNTRIVKLLLLMDGHASALVLFRDVKGTVHAFLQDSLAQDTNSQMEINARNDKISKILLKDLLIKDQNIYQLKAVQQCSNDGNCVLWSLANIQVIVSDLKYKKGCFANIFGQCYKDKFVQYITDQLKQKVSQDLNTVSPDIVNELQDTIISMHKEKKPAVLMNLLTDKIEAIKKERAAVYEATGMTYRTAPISYGTLSIIMQYITHSLTLAVYSVNEDYDLSEHRAVVLEPVNVIYMFKYHLKSFVNTRNEMSFMKSTHTMIIGENEDNWVPLIILHDRTIVDQKQQYKAYYINTLQQTLSVDMLNILSNEYGIMSIKAIPFNAPEPSQYNYALLAVLNAYYFHRIIRNYPYDYEDSQLLSLGLYPRIQTLYHAITLSDEYMTYIRNAWRERIDADIKAFNEYNKFVRSAQDVQALNKQAVAINLKTSNTDCIVDMAGSSKQRKRAILCNEDNRAEDNIQHNQLNEDITLNIRANKQQIYISMAYLVSLGHLDGHTTYANDKIRQFIHYIRNLGAILNQNIDYRSEREQTILNEYSNNINSFDTKYTNNLLLIEQPELKSAMSESIPLLLGNNDQYLVLYFVNHQYQFYSTTYNYRDVLITQKQDIKFDDILAYINALFMGKYRIWKLNDAVYRAVSDEFAKDGIWSPLKVAGDLKLLEHKEIDGIPASIIRKLFLVDHKVPQFKTLNDDNFFSNNKNKITIRINNLHIALLDLDVPQQQHLISLIRTYNLNIDNMNYFDMILDQDRAMMREYTIKVTSILKSTSSVKLETLSEISLQVLKNQLSQLTDIPYKLQQDILISFQKLHQALIKHNNIFDHTTQTLMFLPDIVKAYNSGQYEALEQFAGLMVSDMSANYMINRLYTVVPSAMTDLMQKYAKSPVFKLLVAYAIYTLYKEMDSTPVDTPEYQILNRRLYEQYGTALIMVCEIFFPTLSPILWMALIIEQIISQGSEINQQYHLKLPILESILMSLGFEKQKLSSLIQESDLLNKNFELADSQYQGINIIRIPHIQSTIFEDLSDSFSVPVSLKNILLQKSYDQCAKDCAVIMDYVPSCVIPYRTKKCEVELQDVRLTQYYNCSILLNSPIPQAYAYCYPYYSRTYALAHHYINTLPSNSIKYDYNQLPCLDPLDMSWYYSIYCFVRGISSTNENSFADKIVHLNSTWSHVSGKFSPLDKIKSQDHFMYYDEKVNSTFGLLFLAFDAREGNLHMSFTQRWINELMQLPIPYTSPTFIVRIGYKDYPPTILFNNSITKALEQSHFSFYIPSNNLNSQYMIVDDKALYHISDNALNMSVICSTPNTFFIYSKLRSLMVGNANISLEHKRVLDLECNTCIIYEVLELQVEQVKIYNALGSSRSSKIFLDDQNKNHNTTYRGDIIINHCAATLTVLGISQQKINADNPRWYSGNYLGNYIMQISNIIKTLGTLSISRNKTDINVTLKDYILTLNWHTENTNDKLHIIDPQQNNFIKILEDMDVIHRNNSTKIIEEVVHYNTHITLHDIEGLLFNSPCKSINSTNIKVANIATSQSVYKTPYLCKLTIQYTNNCTILFFTDKHSNEYYHIFPKNIWENHLTINGIDYKLINSMLCVVSLSQYFHQEDILNVLSQEHVVQKADMCTEVKGFNDDKEYYNMMSVIVKSGLRNIEKIARLQDLINCNKAINDVLLDNEQLTYEGFYGITKWIVSHKCDIRMFNLKGNAIGLWSQKQYDTWLQELIKIHSLETLDLSCNGLLAPHIKGLVSKLDKITNISVINLEHNLFGNYGMLKLNDINCKSLSQKLLIIKIRCSDWSETVDVLLSSVIKKRCSNIELISTTRFEDCEDTCTSYETDIQCDNKLFNNLDTYYHILNIVLHSTVRGSDIMELCYPFQNRDSNNTPLKVMFSNKALQPKVIIPSFVELFKINKYNDRIYELDFSNNKFANNLALFNPVLATITNLQMLNVSGNALDNNDANMIFNELSKLNITIDFSWNNITERGLTKMLSNCDDANNITLILSDNVYLTEDNQISCLSTHKTLDRLKNTTNCISKIKIVNNTTGDKCAITNLSEADHSTIKFTQHDYDHYIHTIFDVNELNPNIIKDVNNQYQDALLEHVIDNAEGVAASTASTASTATPSIFACIISLFKNLLWTSKIEHDIDNNNLINSHSAFHHENYHTNVTVNNVANKIIDNLTLGNETHNRSTQVTGNLDIQGNLMLGHILSYKLYGKNKLLQNCYLSPTEERNIQLTQLASEVACALDDFINYTNTVGCYDYDNSASW